MEKELTIIMPVYNVKQYIGQCIQSLMEQTWSNFFCYIVDDGCKDESIDIAQSMIVHDDRFKILHKENGGLSDARNYALAYVTTPYVTFIDSDDYLPNDHYQKMMNYIYDGCDLVVCDVHYCFEDKSKNYRMAGLSSWKSKDRNHLGLLSPMFAWNKIYKSEFFTQLNLRYPLGLWYEDIPVSTLIFALAKKIGYCNDTVVFYRQRQGSIMSETKTERVGEIFTILSLVRANFDKYGLSKDFHDELEYLHIEHLRLYGMFRFLRNDHKQKWLQLSDETLQKYYPTYKLNAYLKNLPLKYRLFIKYTHLLKGVVR